MNRRAAIACLSGSFTSRFAFPATSSATDLFTGGEGGYHSYRIPALAVTRKGSILAFCEARKKSASDAGDIDLVMKRSTDSGKTWSSARIVHEEGGDAEITIGNPSPVLHKPTGVMHLLMTRNNQRVFHAYSADDGQSFSAPTEITSALRGFHFPWTRVGTGPGHGIQLASGRLLVPLWLNERVRYNYRSAVLVSDDAGKTWKAGGLVGPEVPDTNECMAVERADGSVLLNMRAQGSHRRVFSVSRDQGMTWSAPKLIEALIDPVCEASILAWTGRGGHILVFSNPASLKRENMTIRISRDGGDTWSAGRSLYGGPSGYSDLAQTRNGDLLCLFECGDNRYAERLRLSRITHKDLLAG